jgi:ADP-ribose pyrophosphatase YjhB (NUDIX family)
MKYCSDCGSAELAATDDGRGTVRRFDCRRCGARHACNPRLMACCIAECNGQVLLCRRAAEPGPGLWALPGAYVEACEPLQAAAARGARQEAGAVVDELALFRVYNLPKFNEVIAVFRGALRDGRFAAGGEARAAALFPKRDLPWDQLALESSRAALHDYATRRWQATYASPVEDLVWLQPPKLRMPALRGAG